MQHFLKLIKEKDPRLLNKSPPGISPYRNGRSSRFESELHITRRA